MCGLAAGGSWLTRLLMGLTGRGCWAAVRGCCSWLLRLLLCWAGQALSGSLGQEADDASLAGGRQHAAGHAAAQVLHQDQRMLLQLLSFWPLGQG